MRLAHTQTVNAHDWSVGSSAVSPDGSWIASTGHSELRLWDADSVRLVRTLEHHLVQDCAFSPDGRLLACVSLNGTLQVWDVPSGKHVSTENAYRTLHACVFSPDGSLYTLGYENILRRWPMTSARSDSGNLFVREGRSGYMSFCTISPDGGRTVYPRYFLGLQVWEVFSGETILTLDGHPGHVSSCTFSPDGLFVLAAGEDDLIWLWEADTGEQVHILSGHTGYVWECAFTPDGCWIVSASKDKTLRVWDVETGKMTGCLTFESPLMSLGLHPSTPRMVCGDKTGHLHVVEMADVAYGPLIVTAVKDGHGVATRCPACFHQLPLQEAWLGQDITCPGDDCDAELKVNPLVVGRDEYRGNEVNHQDGDKAERRGA